MEQKTQPQLNLDLKNTTAIKGFGDDQLFGQGVILRKVSKFVSGTSEDALLPIPVFYDLDTKKVLVDSVPKELREELKDITFEAA